MYAVIKTGGKQYKVAQGDTLKIETLTAEVGSVVSFDEVLMVGVGEQVKVGAPTVAGSAVKAEVLAHGRGDKIRIVKHRRRKHYHKEQGHRQNFTEVRIVEIGTEIVGA
ncbi:50S ribosomal protein L21 [Solimonas soli]|uniref:50S ribosomal protein L21 n=1 Tax=Solimonas soli TaxID=413479 RepID=UPI00048050A8|nr:50S ribosomal protein L21 [Solimonas soli]